MQPSNPREQKPLFSDRIYKTNHEYRKHISESSPRKIIRSPIRENIDEMENSISERCTQTSKTILQLAHLELGQMSPDSLSPKTDAGAHDSPTNTYIDLKPYVEDIYLPYSRKKYVVEYLNSQKFFSEQATEIKNDSLHEGKSLTKVFLEKTKDRNKGDAANVSDSTINKSMFLQQSSPLKKAMEGDMFKSKSYVETVPNYMDPGKHTKVRNTRFTIKNIKECQPVNNITPVKYFCQHNLNLKLPDEVILVRPQNSEIEKKEIMSFMSPTIASKNKNKSAEMGNAQNVIPPIRRGNSFTPSKPHDTEITKKIPYIDSEYNNASTGDLNTLSTNGPVVKLEKNDKFHLSIPQGDGTCYTENKSSSPKDHIFIQSINKLRVSDWNASVRGLLEVVELCRNADADLIFPHMTSVNQRLIELLRSPRSHVCRTACQAAGHLFEYVKDTRRPEFDEIVDNLLCKTADSNKFIRQDANLALDCMVTHLPALHTVRALCMKGPNHKNHLVRLAVARLLVCVVVISGTDKIMVQSNNESTRKRLLVNMGKFLNDKNLEIRKMGERIYKLLSKDKLFEVILKKHLEKEEIILMRKNLKIVMKQTVI